jgi:hypothetical protein
VDSTVLDSNDPHAVRPTRALVQQPACLRLRPRVSHMPAVTTVALSCPGCRLPGGWATAVPNVSTAVPGSPGPTRPGWKLLRRPAGEMVIRPGQLQVRRACATVPSTSAGLGDGGAIGRDRGREGPQLLVPGVNRLRRRTRDTPHCFRPNGHPFGIIEPHLGSVEIAFGEPRPGQEGGQQGAPPDDVVRQGAQPLPQRAIMPVLAEVGSASSTRSAARSESSP